MIARGASPPSQWHRTRAQTSPGPEGSPSSVLRGTVNPGSCIWSDRQHLKTCKSHMSRAVRVQVQPLGQWQHQQHPQEARQESRVSDPPDLPNKSASALRQDLRWARWVSRALRWAIEALLSALADFSSFTLGKQPSRGGLGEENLPSDCLPPDSHKKSCLHCFPLCEKGLYLCSFLPRFFPKHFFQPETLLLQISPSPTLILIKAQKWKMRFRFSLTSGNPKVCLENSQCEL